jgi:prolyl oligopeptidase
VASWKKDVITRMELFRRSGTCAGELTLPGLGNAGIATEEDRDEAFVTYESFNEPRSIYRTELTGPAAQLTLWARPEVPVDPSMVEVSQHFVASKDGTKVPVFIVHRKGLKLDGSNPCLLYGYGGFNVSMEPGFNATNWPWFEAGGVYALANLRGGGEYGESWHQAGMRDRKQNVFDDLYAVAGWLASKGYTKADRLAVMGGSNGGLLTGVAITQRPDLWSCVVCQVPLLDMLRYQQFLMAKFWVPEYGSSDDADQFRWLRAYSPYHNIKKGQRYPAMLITAGENDTRVHPLHARKMAARLQSLAANDHDTDPILLWVDRDGGHGQGKPLSLRVRDAVDRWSFIMWQTGCCR